MLLKRMVAWASTAYLSLIKPYLGSGCGDLLMRMIPYGSKLSLESTAFKGGGGAPKV